MLKLGMIVDEKERKMIEYDISVAKWTSDPWGFNWEWEEQPPDELFTWSLNDATPEAWQ